MKTKKKLTPARKKAILKENLTGYAFISVNVIWILVFTLYPLIFSFTISFQDWNPIGGGTFVGLKNFVDGLKDTMFHEALFNNFKYAIWTILGGFILSYGAALAVKALPIKRFLRFFYFLPSICSTVMIAMVWSYMLAPKVGLINSFLRLFGISEPPTWLSSSTWAPICLYFIVVWANLGYWMVVFLTGLLDIPETYYEAAKIDGSSMFHSFFKITLPLSTPIIFFYLSMGLITCWGQFDMAVILASSSGVIGTGPDNSLLLPSYLIYRKAFGGSMEFGSASATGWILTIFILIIALVNNKLSKRWVCYDK